MTVTYEVKTLAEAAAVDAPYAYAWDARSPWEVQWFRGIWRCEDGVPVEFIGEDGGEPEDQTLGRDWSWVAPALQAAYELGLRDGGR